MTIDSRTLQRLQNQGVDINNLQNLSEAELEELGITLRTDSVTIPGAVTLEGGIQQITLRNGVILTIDQETLKRLQSQGVDINTLPSLSEAELRNIGIVLTTETISTTRLIPGSTRTITLTDGQILTIEYETLLTLQEQGVDIDNLQALSEEDLERLGLITTTRRITVARPRTAPRTQTTTTTRVTATSTGRRTEDEEGRAAPQPLPPPRARPSPRPRARPQPPPPPPPASGTEARDEEEPAPEPYDFSYTAENDDGSSSTHQAQQTTDGVVTGFYILKGANGEERRVDYIADKDGYRATITTNEIGTETHQTGDAVVMSSAPTPAELAARWQEEQDRQAGRQGGQPNQRRGPTPLTRQGQPQQPRTRTTTGAATGRRQAQPPRQPPPQPAATGTERESRPNIEIITARSARLQASPSRLSRLILEPSAAAPAAQNFGVKI